MILVPDAAQWAGRVIGSGHCVALLQRVGRLPATRTWKRGTRVRGGNIRRGTAIATFSAHPPYHYTNHTNGSAHAAVFIEYAPSGIWVWDQWRGQPVHRRLINYRNGSGRASNDGDRFYVITL